MAEGEDRLLLLSVRPRYAHAILQGNKIAELRRAIPRVAPGTWALIYSSAPTMAIVGAVRVSRVQAGSPGALWKTAGPHAAISKTEFDQYFQNSTRSSALWLADPVSFVDPMPLEYLRAIADFRPPQSYRYLTSDAARRLIDLDDTALRRLGLDDQPAQEADRPVVRSSHDMKIRWMRRVFGWLTHRDRRSPV